MKFECTPLCMNTSLKESYGALWHYKWNHFLVSYVAFLPFTLAGLLGLLDPFFLPRTSTELVPDGYNISFGLYILSTYFWALPCVILWHRLYLLGPEHLMKRRMWPIMTRSFVIMSKVLFLVGLAALVCILLVSVLLFLINALGLNDSVSDFIALSDNEFMRFLIIVFITALTTYLVFLRFSLAICARTIGKRIGLLTSWKLTEKNTMRMFLSFVAIFIPASIATYAILFVYQSIFQFSIFYSGEMLTTSSYIHIFILAPVITLPLSAMCSQCAAFYRHCGGEECPQGL